MNNNQNFNVSVMYTGKISEGTDFRSISKRFMYDLQSRSCTIYNFDNVGDIHLLHKSKEGKNSFDFKIGISGNGIYLRYSKMKKRELTHIIDIDVRYSPTFKDIDLSETVLIYDKSIQVPKEIKYVIEQMRNLFKDNVTNYEKVY